MLVEVDSVRDESVDELEGAGMGEEVSTGGVVVLLVSLLVDVRLDVDDEFELVRVEGEDEGGGDGPMGGKVIEVRCEVVNVDSPEFVVVPTGGNVI